LAAYETISDPEKRRAYDTKWAGIGHSRPTQGEAEKSQAEAAQAECKDDKWTLLHRAAANGQEAMVERLLEAKADINAKGNGGLTALHLAAMKGHETIVQLLLNAKADINAMDDDGRTALYMAAVNDHMNVLLRLWKAKASCQPPFRGLVRIGVGRWVGMHLDE